MSAMACFRQPQITVEQSLYIPLNVRNLCPQRSFRYRVFTGGQMILKRRFKPDRRRRKRQLLNTSVQVFTESAQLDALGINLSDVGMCLFTMANLQVGSQIQVEFLPPRSTELVRVSGIVRHRALYLYGVDFLVDSDAGTIPDRQALYPRELLSAPKQPH